MIIIEGLDATGKSTLAQRIATLTRWQIKETEGPEKSPGEILQRIERYFQLPNMTICDRHPLISQFVYGKLAGTTQPPMYLLQELKRRRPYVIYANPNNKGKHITKAKYDTDHHLKMVNTQRDELRRLYSQFLDEHFPLRVSYTFETMEHAAVAAADYARRYT